MFGGLYRALLIGVTCLLAQAALAQEPPPPEGPPATNWQGDGLKLEVAPLYIEAMTAFFLHRGFPFEEARALTRRGCVYRASIGHDGQADGPVSIDLREWEIGQKGRWKPYRDKDAWLAEFKRRAIPKKALIAFRWALFPTEQTFLSSDYNWGLHLFDLPPGSHFDLKVVWRRGGTRHERVLANLRCTREDEP